MSRLFVSRRPHRHSSAAAQAPVCSDDEQLPDDDSNEPWDDGEPDEEFEPLDDSDLEIDEEPDPDEGDFWIDPDETQDPWN